VKDEDELVTTIAGSTADALLMLVTQMIYANAERIAAATVRGGLPLAITRGPGRDPTARGILCYYGASQEELFRRAADSLDRILRGAKPADIPVEQPLRYDFIINLKTARAMGLTVPQALLRRADEVIHRTREPRISGSFTFHLGAHADWQRIQATRAHPTNIATSAP